MEGGERIKFNF